MKLKKILSMSCVVVIVATSVQIHNNNKQQRLQLAISKLEHKPYDIIQNINKTIEYEYNRQKSINEMIAQRKAWIKARREEEQRLAKIKQDKINELKSKTGLNVIDFEQYNFEISYYSDLVCENSKYGNIDALGDTLVSGTVANNVLPFYTNVYIEGLGKKTVKDRGSERYFGSIEKFDVFVPRNPGEDDGEYFKRVNMMGRQTIPGYILKLGDE